MLTVCLCVTRCVRHSLCVIHSVRHSLCASSTLCLTHSVCHSLCVPHSLCVVQRDQQMHELTPLRQLLPELKEQRESMGALLSSSNAEIKEWQHKHESAQLAVTELHTQLNIKLNESERKDEQILKLEKELEMEAAEQSNLSPYPSTSFVAVSLPHVK